MGRLHVTVVSGYRLKPMDSNGKADPYVTLTCRNHTYKTDRVRKTLEPRWNCNWVLEWEDFTPNPPLEFTVFDWNRWSSNDPMGRLSIQLLNLQPHKPLENSYPLDTQGFLILKILFVGNPPPQTAQGAATNLAQPPFVPTTSRQDPYPPQQHAYQQQQQPQQPQYPQQQITPNYPAQTTPGYGVPPGVPAYGAAAAPPAYEAAAAPPPPYGMEAGKAYHGQIRDGLFHGKRTLIYAGNEKYEGEFSFGKREGHGRYTYADGAVYEGQWVDDRIHGQGVAQFASGNRYDGQSASTAT
uniref:C2 domain-containing protein n=1 Tax=Chromera velia CCMP2878 TaxID=1169474 RepID=A0A0G4H491_9ALVE|eukprot:Cvel_5662.t1-p1 / transcript=Cvel_5662.t1 / gene=Cvel_5662 / organism=Chromera_velia_CCMP2878 / gene_product=MORN repeat-containing protein 3, putative / transcript_product=MORN repeat-containing protein 3, putative / location=Cvel_scaffold267:60248-61135(+) / protein_length=296 / sequence_SO=supercontig / SO=protein_coding / is_pseudo=false